jgi:hypothetical protein
MQAPKTKLRAVCGCGFRSETGIVTIGKERTAAQVVEEAVAHATTLEHTLEFHGNVQALRGLTS